MIIQKNKTLLYKNAFLFSSMYLIFGFFTFYELSFNNTDNLVDFDFQALIFFILSIPSYIFLFLVNCIDYLYSETYLNNISENIFILFFGFLFYFTLFSCYLKVSYKFFLFSSLFLIFVSLIQYNKVFNENFVFLDKKQKEIFLSNDYKSKQSFGKNKLVFYETNYMNLVSILKTINLDDLNYIDTMLLQENENGFKLGQKNIQINILENNFYKDEPISRSELHYRALYYFYINDSIKSLKQNIHISPSVQKYCSEYMFNKNKKDFCEFYQKNISKTDINKIVSKKNYKNLTEMEEFSLLGNLNASQELVKKYTKETVNYAFWLMIGAENGDKTIQREFGEFLKSDTITNDQLKVVFLTRDEKDIRGDFWIKRSQEN